MNRFVACSILACLVLAFEARSEDAEVTESRIKAQAEQKKGNWKNALDLYQKIVNNSQTDPKLVGADLSAAMACIQRLGRHHESDAFLEKATEIHGKNWRVLSTAARHYFDGPHHGFVVAGELHRGHHRGGGQYVNTFQRDRVRALQLMEQAHKLMGDDGSSAERFEYFQQFSRFLMHGGYHQAWRLQELTETSVLPDWEEGYYYDHGSRGAPVDRDGNPVFHKLPASYEAAQSDGERWRWLQMQAMEAEPRRADEVRFGFAQFLHNQFGVRSMAHYGFRFGRAADDDKDDESGPYAVHTLGEDETIARLASGIKRFKLPDEFNFLKIMQDIAARNGMGSQPSNYLGSIFEDRQQYEKAAECYRKGGNRHKLDQITGNWGIFENAATFPAAAKPRVPFRFRNGKKVSLTAHPVLVDKLLGDIKAYLKTQPKQLDWNLLQFQNIGWRLVEKNERQYLGEQLAAWDVDLQPRTGHYDRRTMLELPFEKPGAYFVNAQMENGSATRIVVWVADTVIAKKPIDKKAWYYVADAVTGKPIAEAKLDLFGYRTNWKNNRQEIHVQEQQGVTDADGQFLIEPNQQDANYQWLMIARTGDGRMAFHGFSNVWYGNWHDREYNQPKTFGITDRPVYRPEHAVKFKFWLNRAQYDAEGDSPFAGQTFTVKVNNPKGEKVLEQNFKADAYGGFDGEYKLPKDATLGHYSIQVLQLPHHHYGAASFRVEEYKKPEFEVKIDAPEKPVMLGEKIEARIEARYFFGAPVAQAKVKYKVMRYDHEARWYPAAYWDWFYQPGYWWFAYDCEWYPGFRRWGCFRPVPWWWRVRQSPPEIVAENEVEIGHDGIVKIEIDTQLAKLMKGDIDHKYEISAEVTDSSRRTIVGSGSVMVAREPFKVYAWTDRGHYAAGDPVVAHFKGQTVDNRPVKGKGVLKLLKIAYDKEMKPTETEVEKWDVNTNEEGLAVQQLKAGQPGQYRLSYHLTDEAGHAIEGGYLFTVTGEKFDGAAFRFNDIEIIPDKKEYQAGESVRLLINTDRAGAAVALFVRPANGIYLPPKILRLEGKSTVETVEVLKKDMPNFFIEALTVSAGRVHTTAREIAVPPESRVLNVEVKPAKSEYRPGEKTQMEIKLTEANGEPFSGQAVVSIYDKSVEYISGGSNVPEIKAFFWKWRRHHYPRTEHSLAFGSGHIHKSKEQFMQFLGAFGHLVAELDELGQEQKLEEAEGGGGKPGLVGGRGESLRRQSGAMEKGAAAADAAPAAPMEPSAAFAAKKAENRKNADKDLGDPGAPQSGMADTAVRKNFADTAFWTGALDVGLDGKAVIEVTLPESLTTWKVRTWAMGKGSRVGEGTVEVVTKKNVIVRLQAPRFFTQKDEVVLSANIHNYLKTKKKVEAVLEISGGLEPMRNLATPADGVWKLTQTVEVEPEGETRVDWRVRVAEPGQAMVRMKALTDEESDAMEMTFPAFVHGAPKMEAISGAIRPEGGSASFAFRVPAQRRPEESRIEIRYSPTLAGAMVDALPYLASYPYGCTEQTLSRFLPTVITQNTLMKMGVKLADVRDKVSNLNAQEIGDDRERARQWQRYKENPIFSETEVQKMAEAGVERLASMQCRDGGWGWFSGWGERSWPHTTAYVVHGLQIARQNDVQLEPNMLERGVAWLQGHQREQVRLIRNAPSKTKPWKDKADNLDAFVYMVLADAGKDDEAMREFLFRDKNELAVYSKAMFGLALHKLAHHKQRDELIENVEQYLKQDDENQTAWLELGNQGYWWYWYGSEYEAHAYYLKLLSAVDPTSEKASRLVKYLLNNRKHASYWSSTRDTAVCIEAMADYLKGSGEGKPDLTLEVLVNGEVKKQVQINASNLFTYDNALVLSGKEIGDGEQKIEIRKKGTGPIYFNAYMSNFSLEDHIAKAGLEVKVERKVYRLKRVDKEVSAEGAQGQVVKQKAEKYEREALDNLATLKSGELVEIELEIESKNDYEYLLFEDMKAAGFEPVEVRSGYTQSGMGAYVEYRDERVAFFVQRLARGKHSISYRMRAEIPGSFSALPTRASAMYAPELRANSDEIKLQITD